VARTLAFSLTILIYFLVGYLLRNNRKILISIIGLRALAVILISSFLISFRWHDGFGAVISIVSLVLGSNILLRKVPSVLTTLGIIIGIFLFVPQIEYQLRNQYSESAFSFDTKHGSSHEYEKYYGKILVIDFWFTACGNCYKGFESFESLRKNFEPNKNIAFIAVNNADKNFAQYTVGVNRIHQMGYEFDTVLDTFNVFDQFKQYPAQIIIAPNGAVKYSSTGYNIDTKDVKTKDMKSIIIELLKQ
jgi:thiol-disulfide isomerase/thioredoxin